MNHTQNQPNQKQQRPKKSPAEWLTSIIATSILAAIAGLVIYQWLTKQESPPVVAVTSSGKIREAQGDFYVPFTVTNTGGETAASVQIIAELKSQGQVVATGEQQIDYLSSGEIEKGAFVFNSNPSEGELILRVASYKSP